MGHPLRKLWSIARLSVASGVNQGLVARIPRRIRNGTSIALGEWSKAFRRETTMKRSDLTEKILDIKREKEWNWSYIAGEIGGCSDILIVSALLGHMKLTKSQASVAGKLFGLSKTEIAMLNEVPVRGAGVPMPPTDPLIYRLYELVMINGPALKVLIEEEFGDGIMSAIDFDLELARVASPKGDRVKIGMCGKFLPFKYTAASEQHRERHLEEA
ncbi:cyanase [Nitrobacter sp. TKz-YC01]